MRIVDWEALWSKSFSNGFSIFEELSRFLEIANIQSGCECQFFVRRFGTNLHWVEIFVKRFSNGVFMRFL